MSAPIPVGLVGAGKHGERYLRHIVADVPELRIALLSRRDAAAGREQAARVGARYVADPLELARSPEIEAVIGVAPPTLNLELCVAAARAGKAILLEKPLATSVAAGREIRRAVAEAAVPFLMAHTLRYDSVVRAVRAAVERLGPIHQICLSQRFEPSRLDWLDDPAVSGGGNLLHTGVHSFDLLRYFSGERPIAAMARTARVITRRTEDEFAAVFSFARPLLGSVCGSRATAGRSGAIEIAGERGQVVGDHVHRWALRLSGTSREPIAIPDAAPAIPEVLRDLVGVIRGAKPPPITLDDGLWAVAMAEACYRSAKSRREEAVARV